jgi:hypothetical protein
MRVISYRPPLWARLVCVLICAGVSAALITVNTQDYASGRAIAWLFLPIILAVLILMTFAYRLIMLSFRADAAGVVIHNVFSNRQIPLAQIIGFDIGSRFQLASNAVRVIARSGTFPIDVYGRRRDFFVEHLCDIADELDGWLADAQQDNADQAAG